MKKFVVCLIALFFGVCVLDAKTPPIAKGDFATQEQLCELEKRVEKLENAAFDQELKAELKKQSCNCPNGVCPLNGTCTNGQCGLSGCTSHVPCESGSSGQCSYSSCPNGQCSYSSCPSGQCGFSSSPSCSSCGSSSGCSSCGSSGCSSCSSCGRRGRRR